MTPQQTAAESLFNVLLPWNPNDSKEGDYSTSCWAVDASEAIRKVAMEMAQLPDSRTGGDPIEMSEFVENLVKAAGPYAAFPAAREVMESLSELIAGPERSMDVAAKCDLAMIQTILGRYTAVPNKVEAPYAIGHRFAFRVGEPVICNGYEGTIVEVCTGRLAGMVVVRVPGGQTCVSATYPDCYPCTDRGRSAESHQLFSRFIHVKGDKVKADHVIGVDFAKKAFLILAKDSRDMARTVAVYANNETQARTMVTELGWKILMLEEHQSL